MQYRQETPLTCVDSCADANPKEAEYVGPNTLTRFVRVIIRESYGSHFGIGRPVIHDTCCLTRHISPLLVLHPACFMALDKLREATHLDVVEGVVLMMVCND
jgi:hypothetical protein